MEETQTTWCERHRRTKKEAWLGSVLFRAPEEGEGQASFEEHASGIRSHGCATSNHCQRDLVIAGHTKAAVMYYVASS